jgi:exopolysaccharide production protein ExoY
MICFGFMLMLLGVRRARRPHRRGFDRLPHLINILNGTMSFVGPRPVIEGERLDSRCQAYFACRPGITGLWNIARLDYRNRDIDELYVDECSTWFDFAIMIKTLVLIGE